MTQNRFFRRLAVLCSLLVLGACAQPTITDPNDPNEVVNRSVHSFNKGVDKALLRPAAKAYGTVVPDPISQSVRNFGQNLSTPSYAINKILQGQFKSGGTEILRFGINSTLGIAGLFDPATELGIAQNKTDFGETLHRWGADQGSYVELPLLGPSTERDTVGLAVDMFLNPVSLIQINDIEKARSTARAANVLRTRNDIGATLDDVLYNSVDSYSQSKILYLQRRNAELSRSDETASVLPDTDPNLEYDDEYEDFYE